MNKILKTTIKALNWIIVASAALLGITIVLLMVTGVELYYIKTASMTPEYPVGALILVDEVDTDELEEGDVITFRLSGNVTATHRIVEVIPDEDNPDFLRFRTKGDANEDPDASLVDQDEIIGSPIYCAPDLGRFITKIKSPPGLYYAIAVGAVLLLFVFVSDSIIGDKKKQDDNTDKKGELKE